MQTLFDPITATSAYNKLFGLNADLSFLGIYFRVTIFFMVTKKIRKNHQNCDKTRKKKSTKVCFSDI